MRDLKRFGGFWTLIVGIIVTVGQPAAVFANNVTNATESKEEAPVHLLFIHHSCGGQLLAEPGEQIDGHKDSGTRCIYSSHQNGGGLRRLLTTEGFDVHELSYESRLGEDTDLHHWRVKFTNHMDELLRTEQQDRTLPLDVTNRIVIFKSCYPNNDFIGPGSEPGDPDSSELTVVNAKAAYNSLLPQFRNRPDVLFIAFTAPPKTEPQASGFKAKMQALFKGKPKSAEWAREFNTWLADRQNGWLADYSLPNVVVFDYYDILTGGGKTNWSAYPTREGKDSHPNCEGNSIAARAFVPFLADAWAGMGD